MRLDSTNRAAFEEALGQSHQILVRVEVYDLSETYLDVLDAAVTGGQVDVDATTDISRQLSLTIADPFSKFHFSPGGTLWVDKMLKVWYGVWVASLEDWVEVPIFFGPVSEYARDGGEVTIEAQSKEALYLPPRTQVRPPGPNVTSVAKYVKSVAQGFGETRFGGITSFGTKRVPKDFNLDITLDKDEKPEDKNRRPTIRIKQPGSWGLLQKLARGVGFQLFYNGNGELTARPSQKTSIFTFHDGTGGTILSEPGVGFNLAVIVNAVHLESKDPNRNIIGPMITKVELPSGHPLSKQSLSWNGVSREYVHTEKYHHQLSPADARARALDLLEKFTRSTQEVEFECLVIPHLEPGDVVHVDTGTIHDDFDVLTFTIPLTAGETMSFGYTKQVPTGKTVTGGKLTQRRSHKRRRH